VNIRLKGWQVIATTIILGVALILFIIGVTLGGRSSKLIAENRAIRAENKMLRQQRVKIIKLEKEIAGTSKLRKWMEDIVGIERSDEKLPNMASAARTGLSSLIESPFHTRLFPELETSAAAALRRRDFVPRGLPVEGALTARFGEMDSRYLKPHSGVDIAAPKGSIVAATATGIVAAAINDPLMGNEVVIDHLNGYKTQYGHLEAITVKKGDWIERGERIGTVGSTGHAEGAHVHYTLESSGIAIDPLAEPENKKKG